MAGSAVDRNEPILKPVGHQSALRPTLIISIPFSAATKSVRTPAADLGTAMPFLERRVLEDLSLVPAPFANQR